METASKIAILIVSLFMLNTCNAEIKMIQAIIRHGDRYPESKKTLLAIYPNDPYFNDTWEPYGKMGLAKKGKTNAFKMGMFLRNRYDELLGSIYDEKEVYFRSTDTSRTITTGRWVAAGLYSDPRPQNLNSTLFPIYIPINVVPYEEDTLNNAFMLCENYFIDKQISEKIVKKQKDFKNLGTLLKYLSVHTGIEHSSCSQSFGLYHNFVAQVLNLYQ
ncbi:testicular acid phosphatase homolog [Cotesia typhae]|uniref:testicular acid phosphatase homolog n=1 Tax=Cotesia typhae TaxID=2053667 RepID=UPI003D692336